ncbi:hypothetical protein [Streptomyces decoyicus]
MDALHATPPPALLVADWLHELTQAPRRDRAAVWRLLVTLHRSPLP